MRFPTASLLLIICTTSFDLSESSEDVGGKPRSLKGRADNAGGVFELAESLWGSVHIPATWSGNIIADAIQSYWSAWLQQDQDALSAMFQSDGFTLISQQTGRRVVNNMEEAVAAWNEEWNSYERNQEVLAFQLDISHLAVEESPDGNGAKATYWMSAMGGDLWNFTDTAFVTQFFQLNETGTEGSISRAEPAWKVVYHADSWNLDYDPATTEQAKITFYYEYVYPVNDLGRASQFYDDIFGPPELDFSNTSRTYELNGHRFIISTDDLDGYATTAKDLPTGYAVFHVGDIDASHDAIRNDKNGAELLTEIMIGMGDDEAEDPYFLVADPSGNVLVIKEVIPDINPNATDPELLMDGDDQLTSASMTAWLEADADKFQALLQDNTVWFDDTSARSRIQGLIQGASNITSFVEAEWKTYDRNPETGITADMILTKPVQQTVASNWKIVTYKRTLMGLGVHPFQQIAWLTQVFDSNDKLVLSTMTRVPLHSGSEKPMVLSLDYTGYPVVDLEKARQFYQNTMKLGGPYTDSEWYGFWSLNAVFGIFTSSPDIDKIPRNKKTNGYASLWTVSAQETYAYLQVQGSSFPVVPSIVDVSGVEYENGYIQVLATDPDGSALLFTEYDPSSVAPADDDSANEGTDDSQTRSNPPELNSGCFRVSSWLQMPVVLVSLPFFLAHAM